MSGPGPRMVVVGAGNPDRGDDGVGPAVAARVAAAGLPTVDVVVDRGDAVALLDAWDGARVLYIVDACRSGAEPGTVRRLDASAASVSLPGRPLSPHGLGLIDAVELARCLGRLPPAVWLYAIEGAVYRPGAALSAPVAHAVERVAAEVVAAARRQAAHGERSAKPAMHTRR